MKTLRHIAAILAATSLGGTGIAAPGQETTAPAPAPAAAPAGQPKLIVAISVDQLSADLFAQYRRHFTGGLARLQQGVVFPSGYQSHNATETCPGHATILTGAHPGRSGIIANTWTDLSTARADKQVYCAEDESVPGSTSAKYTVSDVHLKVPTLGELMKAANPASRVVSVAGKDRAAVMMGGHKTDQIWWWDGKAFASYAGRTAPETVNRANAAVSALIAQPQGPLDVPGWCAATDRAVAIGGGKTVGTGRFERAAGDARAFRASPAFDGAVFALAAGLVQEMKLGKGNAPDIIAIGASATDYVGHTYGTGGLEMCLNLANLDASIDGFFRTLDAQGIDYAVVLTADHGGNDLPEREVENGAADAQRVDPALAPFTVGKAIAEKLGLAANPIAGDAGNGDIWIEPAITGKARADVLAATAAAYRAMPQVAAAFTKAEIQAVPAPTTPPDSWTLIERVRAGHDPARSGDLTVLLKPRVTPIPSAAGGYVATHGSPWDYDRRVPIIFWRKGMAPYEQPLSVQVVDIMPTLAALIDLPVTVPVDGKCIDIIGGPATSCK